jgi:hypothetical protein
MTQSRASCGLGTSHAIRAAAPFLGRLNKRARHVLGLTCMQKAWPSVLQKWVLTG